MKVRADQYARSLERELPGAFLMSGEEPRQKQEALDLVLRLARAQGFEERLRYEIDLSFDWSQLMNEWNAPSLFAPRRVFDLRLNNLRLSKDANAWLIAAASARQSDNLLLLSVGKLEAAQKKSAWVQAFEQHGLWLEVWPLKDGELLAWMERRLRAQGLSAEHEALQLLGEHVEGNLLAAAQEIDKLSLLFPKDTRLNSEIILSSVANSSRHTVFEIGEAIVQSDVQRALRVLHGLQNEGEEPILIAWAITREIRLLADLAYRLEHGENPAQAQKALRIRDAQMRHYTGKARAGSRRWQSLLLDAAQFDRIVKGVAPAGSPRPWPALTALMLKACRPAG
ncbi:MAG: DNA polymerase III subunit delta [Gammaproteobacteria bacterium 28-57-27]|nr:MAG: DNA polymerase III subunit delta [Gammaproteobacteria bacterium 28-57-27]